MDGRSTLGLKQYNKDTPPGWKPRSYPFREYTESLAIWLKMTRLDEDQIGPAIMSRLEGGALKLAKKLTIQRINAAGVTETYRGVDAVSLFA